MVIRSRGRTVASLSRRSVRLIRLIGVARGQRPDQRSLDARDVFAHQPFGAPGFACDDRFMNAVMIVVAAAHVTMLEGDDVAARRCRDAMAGPDHLAELRLREAASTVSWKSPLMPR